MKHLNKENKLNWEEYMLEQVKKVLDKDVIPILKTHRGSVKLISVSPDGVVKVKLTGACHGCPLAQQTLVGFVEKTLKSKIPDVRKVIG